MIVLTIPRASPSNNVLSRGDKRRAWYEQKRWDKLVHDAIWEALAEGEVSVEDLSPEGKRKVTIFRHSQGKLEYENFIGGLKVVIDALRERKGKRGIIGNNLIIDDNDEWLEHGDHQQFHTTRKGGYTTIQIEDVTEERRST